MEEISLQRAKRIAARVSKIYNRCDEYRTAYFFVKTELKNGQPEMVYNTDPPPLVVNRFTGEVKPYWERPDIFTGENFICKHKVTLR